MGIDLEPQRTFIIEQVMNVVMTKITSEEAFNRKKASRLKKDIDQKKKQEAAIIAKIAKD